MLVNRALYIPKNVFTRFLPTFGCGVYAGFLLIIKDTGSNAIILWVTNMSAAAVLLQLLK
jgi:hypothetical protein